MNSITSFDDTDRGAIWKNERKERDTQPDFTGNAKVDGIDYWVSGWKREPGANPASPALRLSFTRKSLEPVAASPTGSASAPDFDDDLPF